MSDVQARHRVADAIPGVHPRNQTYSADEVVEAYERAVDRGRADFSNVMRKALRENISKTYKASTDFLAGLDKETRETFRAVYIRADDVANFTTLFLVPDKLYCTNRMLEIIERSQDVEDDMASDTYSLDLQFAPYTRKTDEHKIVCDGFFRIDGLE